MARKLKYIAIILTVVFTSTLLPWQFLHFHNEDGHQISLVQPESNHHCELDELLCQDFSFENCKHSEHISTELRNCDICSYQFVKLYTHNHVVFQPICLSTKSIVYTFTTSPSSIILVEPKGRAPPKFA